MRRKAKKIKRKKGSYSILMITLTLILSTIFIGYIDIARKTYAINEVQQRMDRAGLNALNKSIDKRLLQEEIFGIDNENYIDYNRYMAKSYEGKILKKYNEEVRGTLSNQEFVKDFSIKKSYVSFDSSVWGTGSTMKRRPQVTLNVVASVKVKNLGKLDVFGTNSQSFYDAKTGQNFTVTVESSGSDGYSSLLVQSATRVVYR